MSRLPRDGDRLTFTRYDPADEARRESLMGLGNGLLFARAAAPEAALRPSSSPHRYAGLYRAGLYDTVQREIAGERVRNTALVNLPDPFGLSFRRLDEPDDAWFGLDRVQLLEYRHECDLLAGSSERSIAFRDAAGRHSRLRECRFASLADPRLLVLAWWLTPLDWDGELVWCARLDGRVRNANLARNAAYEGGHFTAMRAARHGAMGVSMTGDLAHLPDAATVAAELRVEADLHTRIEGACATQHWRMTATAGRPLAVLRLAAVATALDADVAQAVPGAALASLRAARDFGSLHDAQRRHWQAVWEVHAIDADDTHMQRALRYHAAHLLETVLPNAIAQDVGLPARGWQEAYFGQVFWDEIFAFPYLSLRHPEAAERLLAYRHRRLDAARRRAREAGLPGALYPWRSAASGAEETPRFQCNPLTGRWMPDHTHLQHHIGAAIAWNARHHALARGIDATPAGEPLLAMCVEIARFWAGCAQRAEQDDRYDIRHVVGPDEYHNAYPGAGRPGLHNNAYTNVMAAWTLCHVADWAEQAARGTPAAQRRAPAVDDAERAHWRRVAGRLRLGWCEGGRVLEQFEGFSALREMPRETIDAHARRPRLDWWLDAGGDSTDRWALTKQADVLMLFHLLTPDQLQAQVAALGYRPPADWCRATLDYYLQRITHESSLSRPVCAGALAPFDAERSWAYFRHALQTDLGPDLGAGGAQGLHLGAMAATLDVLQRRYLGVMPEAGTLRLAPCLPQQLDRIGIGFGLHGHRLRLRLDGSVLRLAAAAGDAQPLTVVHGEEVHRLRAGAELRIVVR